MSKHTPGPWSTEGFELCNTCGWKTLIPGDVCLNCEREAAATSQKQSESAYQRGYMDGTAKGRRDAVTDAAEKQKTNYLNGYCTGRTELLDEQEKQNPVAWMVYTLDGKSVCVTDNPADFTNEHRALPLYTTPPAAPVQEPVACIRSLTDQCAALIQERDELQKQVWRYEKHGVTCQTYGHKIESSCSECNVHENYTTPPAAQRQWVGLTDEEIYACDPKEECWNIDEVARAIEAKLKEKNT